MGAASQTTSWPGATREPYGDPVAHRPVGMKNAA